MTTTDYTAGARTARGRAPSGRAGALQTASAPAVGYDEGRTGFSLALLLAVALMIPTQFSFAPGGVLLTPLRLALILLVLPGVMMFLSRQPMRLYSFDVFYIAFSLWTGVAMIVNRGVGPGIERAGQFVLESAVIYVILQGSLRTLSQIRAIYRFFFWCCVVLLILAIPEIMAGEHILQNFFNEMAGLRPLEGSLAGERLGFMRVTSIFAHPILYGLFNASLFAMLWYFARSGTQRLFYCVIVVLGTFVSLSSGPMLVTLIQLGLIITEYLTRQIKKRALLIGSAIAAMLIFVHFASNRGIFVLMVLFTLSPASAYNRRQIWENGIDDVLRSPIFGIRPETWTRPFWMKPSIDNYWLFQAMQGGIPSVLFVALAIALIIRCLYRRPARELPPALEGLRRGWLFLIIAMILCGATVHFFDKMQPYFAFVVATGAASARLFLDWERQRPPEGDTTVGAAPAQADRGPPPTATGKPRTWL